MKAKNRFYLGVAAIAVAAALAGSAIELAAQQPRAVAIDEDDIVTRAEEIGHRAWKDLVERYPDVDFPIRLPRLPRA